jgi:hypothetical protein
MTRPAPTIPRGSAGASRTGGTRGRRVAVATGLLAVLAYLAGSAMSGHQSPLARRPLLDGLAPPPPYRWVRPPPELTSVNKKPAGVISTVRLGPSGSEVSAISTGDGQANLVLDANAIAPSPGQREVEVAIEPVDPANLAAAPRDLVLAGNAYRIRFSYRPSGDPVTTMAGKATISLVFPLLSIPVSSPFDTTVLGSPDGRHWTRQASTATPGSHQVASTVASPGYVIAAVPPAPPDQAVPNRVPLLAGLAAASALIALAAVLLARRLAAVREGDGGDYEDDDYDEDGEDREDREDGEGAGDDRGDEDPDRGTEERR